LATTLVGSRQHINRERSTDPDLVEAFKMFKLGAKKFNDPYCMVGLANLYMVGDGVEYNFDRAERWLKKAEQSCNNDKATIENVKLNFKNLEKIRAAIMKEKNKTNVYSCAVCNKPDSDQLKLKRCSRCHKVYYCSRECQVKDWKQHAASCKVSKPLETSKAVSEEYTVDQCVPYTVKYSGNNHKIYVIRSKPFGQITVQNGTEAGVYFTLGVSCPKLSREDLKALKCTFEPKSPGVNYWPWEIALQCVFCDTKQTETTPMVVEIQLRRNMFDIGKVHNRIFPRMCCKKCLETVITTCTGTEFSCDNFTVKPYAKVWSDAQSEIIEIQKKVSPIAMMMFGKML
jgi:hypothetical protein